MVIMVQSSASDMSFRYGSVDEADLINAADKVEDFLESGDHPVDRGQKKSPQEESQNHVSS